jgi:hypothetical protein
MPHLIRLDRFRSLPAIRLAGVRRPSHCIGRAASAGMEKA